MVGVMGLYGSVTEFPEILFAGYASSEGVAAAQVIETGCLNEITASVLTVPLDEFYDRHPLQTEPARTLFLANDVGGVRVDAPLLLVAGTADTTVVLERMRDLRMRDVLRESRRRVSRGAFSEDLEGCGAAVYSTRLSSSH